MKKKMNDKTRGNIIMKILLVVFAFFTTSQAFATDFTRGLMYDSINSHLTCEGVKRKMSVEEDSYGGSERWVDFKNGSEIICNRYSDMVTTLTLNRAGVRKFFAPSIEDLFDLDADGVTERFGTADDRYDGFNLQLSYDLGQSYPITFILRDGWMEKIVVDFPMNDG